MQSDSVSLRAGVHAGDVMVKGDDLFGEAVNVAARLQASARPGACLVSKTAVDVAGASLGVALRPESSMRLKGIPNPVEAYSIDLDGDSRLGKTSGKQRSKTSALRRPMTEQRSLGAQPAAENRFWRRQTG